MPAEDPVALLNAAACLYLRALGEPRDNSLRLVVQEAIAGPAGGSARIKELPKNLRTLLGDARPIISNATCHSYELSWPSYIAYAVRNESYATVDDAKTYEGNWLRRYSTSPFLEFVDQSTWADPKHPGPFVHYAVITLNHVVDIASLEAPVVRRFKSTGARADG